MDPTITYVAFIVSNNTGTCRTSGLFCSSNHSGNPNILGDLPVRSSLLLQQCILLVRHETTSCRWYLQHDGETYIWEAVSGGHHKLGEDKQCKPPDTIYIILHNLCEANEGSLVHTARIDLLN